MANKLTYETDGRKFIIRGSQRQPTIIEALNYLNEVKAGADGCFVIAAYNDGGYIPPESVTELTLIQYGSEVCPVCGHEHDMYKDECPVCQRKWNE